MHNGTELHSGCTGLGARVTVRSASGRLRAVLGAVNAPRPSTPGTLRIACRTCARATAARIPVRGAARGGRGDCAVRRLAVWINGHPDQAADTRAALDAGTVRPAAILEGRCLTRWRARAPEHVALVRAGDRPAPTALERLGQAIALAPDAHVITCDDDQVSAAGVRGAPRLAPGPSPDRWLACDDSGAMLVVARERAASLHGTLSAPPRGATSSRCRSPDRPANATPTCR